MQEANPSDTPKGRGRMNWHGALRLAFVVSLAIPLGIPLGNCGICTDVPDTESPDWEMAIVNPNRYLVGRGVAEGPGGDLFVTGYSYQGETRDMALVLRRTEFGNPRWIRHVGMPGLHLEGVALAATPEGGALVFGNANPGSDFRAESDYFLLMMDGDGNTLWQRRFGGARDDRAVAIAALADGYALLGTTNSTGSGGTDLELIRIGGDGAVRWARTYGGSANDDAADLAVTGDGGFAMLGETESFGSGEIDLYLVKAGADGEEEWHQSYGFTNYNFAGALQQTADGGFILAGNVGPAYLVKTSADGSREWEQVLGGNGYYNVRAIASGPDGGFVISGSGNTEGEYFSICSAAFAMEADRDGAHIRTRLFGELDETNCWRMVTVRDGGYVLAGVARGGFMPEDEPEDFQSAVYLAKFRAGGE